MAKIIDGKAIAQEVRNELKGKVADLTHKGITPGLTVILVGNNPASEVYVRGKIRACEEVGIRSELISLPAEVSEADLLLKIKELNKDDQVHGILVQLPLPNHISESNVIETIAYQKDVDGFHPESVGRMVTGLETFLPCTPHGIMELLSRTGVDLNGKHAVVVGRSNIVGKPMALLLQQQNATVTMCHSRTVDLPSFTRQADVLVAAVGKVGLITKEHVKEGAVVIDVAMNRDVEGKLCGDVLFDEVSEVASAITPVPGGVGPMTIAMLLKNTVISAERVLQQV
ncbi:bifunctional methylenetetrahydrofolate dehydrogenase/methenyltetrahydrofolate cyclohydrolase FolD [Risungbinella massiliensis]|uniref:bifunctional methylenetetrahydrofolate dehydrogenase/methenyltetrahydrofolate cyclohydrolase FolD n=1 Tax=Risungbinella massiliensis TaxID=1329796 RepID=UPI0005CC7A2C|nr:bifunctional methylenetetrahydrofolate dehydrogenase/methenyltetrahydrofolate cyclohydrolase FolD [Risungbinella massiliensis]